MADGRKKMVWEGTVGSIHYKNNPEDPLETWKDIIVDVVPSSRPGYDYEMTRASYNVFFKNLFSGRIVRYEKQGFWMDIIPGELRWVNMERETRQLIGEPRGVKGSPVPEKPNHLYWEHAYGGNIHFEWVTSNTRLLKYVIVENFNNLPPLSDSAQGYAEDVFLELEVGFDIADGVLIKENENSGDIEFTNANNELLWFFGKPKYWDSNENADMQDAQYNVRKNETNDVNEKGEYTLVIRVPYAWLQTATYPAYIDPTIDAEVDVDANDNTSVGSYASFHSNAEQANEPGADTAGTKNAFALFTGISGLGGSTIDVATYQSYVRSSELGTALTKVYAQDSADPTTPSTAADHQGRTRTTAGVDWDSYSGTPNSYSSTISIVSVIQELADSYDPSAILILQDDDGSSQAGNNYFRFYAHERDGNGARLHIEYTEVSGYQPRPPAINASGNSFLIF